MTYYVAVKNASVYDLSTSDHQTIAAAGGSWESALLGDAWVQSPAWGAISFLDIADHHIGGDSGGEWGVLVSYQGEEIVARYDGSPILAVEINPYGQALVGGTGFTLRQVSLPALTIDTS
jgi:hypothetical protein